MLVVLDLQHRGKPGKRDLGASHDLDGDGVIDQLEHEASLTPIYVDAARKILEASGVEVVVVQTGAYSGRHKRAGELAGEHVGPVAYVACHLNKGGGDYGLVVRDYRSNGGARLATEMRRALLKRLPLARVVHGQTGPAKRPSGSAGALWDRMPTHSGAQHWPRAWSTIKGIWAGPSNLCGICFEPVFMDTHADQLDDDGLELIGCALAGGLLAYLSKAGG